MKTAEEIIFGLGYYPSKSGTAEGRLIVQAMEEYAKQTNNKQFAVGYTCACATMIEQHGEDTMVQDAYKCNFMSVKQLVELGVEDRDIKLLTPTIKEIERKRKLLNLK